MKAVREVAFHIDELDAMRRYPEPLWYAGNTELLKRRKVAVVGSRKPYAYSRQVVTRLASQLARREVAVVSGAALGVDAAAHSGAGAAHTIAVMGNGLDLCYPAANRTLIAAIEREGLTLSQFAPGTKAAPWSFVVRNEVVVALGEVLVVAQADEGSGTLRSVEFALSMNKPVFALPHRLGESEGSNRLLAEGLAQPIYDIDAFCDRFGSAEALQEDDFLKFCRTSPTLQEAIAHFGERVYAAELEGEVVIREGRVVLV